MPKVLNTELRSYQKLGLSWLQFLRELGAGGILADDMGLGKTVMALAFLQEWKERDGPSPSLVVCPTSVATNWVREAARFTPDLRIHLLYGPERSSRAAQSVDGAVPSELTSSDLLITTYALLRRDAEALSAVRFRCAILDEAQMVKNADTEARRAAGRLDAEMHLALSGTPIENRLRELWSLASYANPGILGTAKNFETRYERPLAADRASPAAAELRAVIRPFLLRRTKDDVLQDLPPKTEIDKFVSLTPADKRKYDALAHTLRASVAKDLENKGPGHHSLSVFAALTRLRQMACDPALIDASLATGRSAKRETFLEIVEELVAEGRRALVFSQFVKLLTLWRAELDAKGIAYEYLDGSTTHRERAVDRFQNGTAPLFLVSASRRAGSGLNLTAADTVIHCDPWWNPAVEDQATDRAHRIGQDQAGARCIRLIARGHHRGEDPRARGEEARSRGPGDLERRGRARRPHHRGRASLAGRRRGRRRGRGAVDDLAGGFRARATRGKTGPMKIAGRTILVTGGATGIGLGLARRMVAAGATVIAAGRREDALADARAQVRGLQTIGGDVSTVEGRTALADQVLREHPTLDVLVNNAGIQNHLPPLTQPQDWSAHERELGTNLAGPMHLTMLLLPHLLARAEAATLNVTSGLAFAPYAGSRRTARRKLRCTRGPRACAGSSRTRR